VANATYFPRSWNRQELWGRFATCGGLVTRPNRLQKADQRRLKTGAQDTICPTIHGWCLACQKVCALGTRACRVETPNSPGVRP